MATIRDGIRTHKACDHEEMAAVVGEWVNDPRTDRVTISRVYGVYDHPKKRWLVERVTDIPERRKADRRKA